MYMAVCCFPCSQTTAVSHLVPPCARSDLHKSRLTLVRAQCPGTLWDLVRTLCVLVRGLVREPAAGTSRLTLVRPLSAGHKVQHKAHKEANRHIDFSKFSIGCYRCHFLHKPP